MTGERGRVQRAPAEAGHRRLRRPKAARTQPAGGSLTVESLTKMLGAAALLAYATGLLIVNAYLLQFEVSDFGLFRARFVLTGTLFLSVVALATLFPVAAVVVAVDAWRPHAWWPASWLGRVLARLTFTFVAGTLAWLPFAVYDGPLAQTPRGSLELYLVAGILGGMLLLAGYYFVLMRRRQRHAVRTPLRAWTFSRFSLCCSSRSSSSSCPGSRP